MISPGPTACGTSVTAFAAELNGVEPDPIYIIDHHSQYSGIAYHSLSNSNHTNILLNIWALANPGIV